MSEERDAVIGDKIKRLRSFRGLTCAELAESIGCTRPYLSAVENGRYPASTKILRKLSKALSVPSDYFTSPQEPGLEDTTSLYAKDRFNRPTAPVHHSGNFTPTATLGTARRISTRQIPFVALSPAGEPSVRFDEYPSGDTDTIDCPPDISDDHAFAIRIDGDDMAPLIPPGAMAFVSPHLPLRENRPVVVKLNNGDMLVRRYQAKADQVILSPANPAHLIRLVEATEVDWIYPIAKISVDLYNEPMA